MKNGLIRSQADKFRRMIEKFHSFPPKMVKRASEQRMLCIAFWQIEKFSLLDGSRLSFGALEASLSRVVSGDGFVIKHKRGGWHINYARKGGEAVLVLSFRFSLTIQNENRQSF